MRRFLRYLRIAFSATCLIACALLIVLWVRSYRLQEVASTNFGNPKIHIIAVSSIGDLQLACFTGIRYTSSKWFVASEPNQSILESPRFHFERNNRGPDDRFGFPAGFILGVPHWFAVVLSTALAGAPWIRRRFSLRTLLIAMTLVAVVLGLVVWLSR